MANIITRSTMPSQLLEGIKINVGVGYDEGPRVLMSVYDQENSGKDVEKYQEIIPIGLLSIKLEAKDAAMDDIGEGPTTYISNVSRALSYQISHEDLQDNLYPKILKQALDVGRSARESKEIVLANRLNTVFSTAATDLLANGQPVCSLTQPLTGTGGLTDQNRPTISKSLSEASLTVDVANIRKFRDPKGKRITVRPTKLMTPVELEVRAFKLLNTELSVGTAVNDLNPMRVGSPIKFFDSQPVSSPYLTNPLTYFIRTNVPGLVLQNRESLRTMEDVIIRRMVQEVVVYERYGVGVYDYRCIYANPGA